MKLLNFSIIKLTLCLILGIIIGYYTPINLRVLIYINIALLFILGIGLFIVKFQYKQSVWFGILIFISTISIGALTVNTKEQWNFKNHYSKHQAISNDSIYNINFRIREVLKSGNYYDKYVVDILEINTKKVLGKSLLNVQRDTRLQHLEVDEILSTYSKFKPLNEPLSPHQFNYKKYLKKQYIYHQLFASHSQLLKLKNKRHTAFGFAAQLRAKINENLNRFNFKNDELAIINALLLGQRQDLSKEIYNSYTQAGVIHILAVSGLHVGIILMLLNYLFKPIEAFKNGKILKAVLIVLLLWSFAIIAGLSASVVRAVTMFTIIAIAMHLKRPTNIYNTLAISMFSLLLFKPTFLFDLGFQLSYLAVLAIVSIQPMLYNLWKPKHTVFDFFWKVFTVSLAAQFGVIPLSLYYFHQFPSLFFLSNLVIIPCLGIILGLGICIILLALLNMLPSILAAFYEAIIGLMNAFVSWVSHQEAFLFKNISFELGTVIVSYILIIAIVFSLKKKTYKSVISVLIIILFCQGLLFYNSYKSSASTFIVFHKSRRSIIGIKHNRKLELHHSLNNSIVMNDKTLINFKIGEGIVATKMERMQSIYMLNTKKLLVIDSLGVYNTNTFKADIILLRNSPKINLKRLIDSLHPDLIISDGSNFKSYQKRWVRTSTAKKIPFHQTSKKGAFIYNY